MTLRESVVEAMERRMLELDAVGLYSDEAHTLSEAALDAALDVLEGSAASWEEAEDGGEIEHINYSLLDLIERLRAGKGSE